MTDLRRIGDILKMRRQIRLDSRRLLERIGLIARKLSGHRQHSGRHWIIRNRDALQPQRIRRPGHPDVVVDQISPRLPRRVDIFPRILINLRHTDDFVRSDRHKEPGADDEALLHRRAAREP